MLAADLPTTIAEAELQGWQDLTVFCVTCRLTAHLPLRHIARLTPERSLARIAARLVCKRCGGRPSRPVALYRLVTPVPTAAPVGETLVLSSIDVGGALL
jgi:hypothetical protein